MYSDWLPMPWHLAAPQKEGERATSGSGTGGPCKRKIIPFSKYINNILILNRNH